MISMRLGAKHSFPPPVVTLFRSDSASGRSNFTMRRIRQGPKNPFEVSACRRPMRIRSSPDFLACHGKAVKDREWCPRLSDGKLDGFAPGEIFLVQHQGSRTRTGPRGHFAEQVGWQIVTYVEALAPQGGALRPVRRRLRCDGAFERTVPHAPFTDFRYEAPGRHSKSRSPISRTVRDEIVGTGPEVVAGPANAWPIAPAGSRWSLISSALEESTHPFARPETSTFRRETAAGRNSWSSAA